MIVVAGETVDCNDDDDADDVAVKTKFAYAYTQEFPYRITHVLECEFFLLEAMVITVDATVY